MLDILVQSRRTAKAAERLLRKLLKKHGKAPRVMITHNRPAIPLQRVVMPGVTSAAQGLEQPRRDLSFSHSTARGIMKRFKSAGQAQRFLSVHDQAGNLFRRPANTNAAAHRQSRAQPFDIWAEVTGLAAGF